MKITYTKHAERKFDYLKELKFNLKPEDIEEAISNPDHFEEDKVSQVKIILKSLNKRLNLRVVYSDKGGIIRVITFYPTPKGRYIK